MPAGGEGGLEGPRESVPVEGAKHMLISAIGGRDGPAAHTGPEPRTLPS
jgi:hypothetical protein